MNMVKTKMNEFVRAKGQTLGKGNTIYRK